MIITFTEETYDSKDEVKSKISRAHWRTINGRI